MAGKEAAEIKRQRLDIPEVVPLERRLLVTGSPSKPVIGPVAKSDMLSRLQQFLPVMAEANQKMAEQLQDMEPGALDIEHFDKDAGEQYVEMDLACGVIDLKDETGVQAAEAALQQGVAVEEMLASARTNMGCSDPDDSDSDSDSEELAGPSGTTAMQGSSQATPQDPEQHTVGPGRSTVQRQEGPASQGAPRTQGPAASRGKNRKGRNKIVEMS